MAAGIDDDGTRTPGLGLSGGAPGRELISSMISTSLSSMVKSNSCGSSGAGGAGGNRGVTGAAAPPPCGGGPGLVGSTMRSAGGDGLGGAGGAFGAGGLHSGGTGSSQSSSSGSNGMLLSSRSLKSGTGLLSSS